MTYDAERAFLGDISLYRYIGNPHSIHTAKTIVSEYFNILSDDNQYQHPPSIALVGQKGSGRNALAFSIHNSLGHTKMFEIDGPFISLNQLENATDYCDTILIRNGEGIGNYHLPAVCNLLKNRILEVPIAIGKKEQRTIYFDGLLIVAFESGFVRVSQALTDATDVRISTRHKFENEQILNILKQRTVFYGWTFSDRKTILGKIVEVSANNVSMAVELLVWAKRCSVANNTQKILLRHLKQSIEIVDGNGISV